MQLKARHYGIVILALITALLHFGAAFDSQLFPDHRPDLLFTLNGLGYIGLLLAYFMPLGFLQARHRFVWWTFFVYVIVTIAAWAIIWVGMNVIIGHMPFFSHDSLYGVPAKIAELILLVLLWSDKP